MSSVRRSLLKNRLSNRHLSCSFTSSESRHLESIKLYCIGMPLGELLAPSVDICWTRTKQIRMYAAYFVTGVFYVLGMTLNCTFSLSLVAFCTDVSWGRPVSVFSYTVAFIYESWLYLLSWPNSLSVLMCCKSIKCCELCYIVIV